MHSELTLSLMLKMRMLMAKENCKNLLRLMCIALCLSSIACGRSSRETVETSTIASLSVGKFKGKKEWSSMVLTISDSSDESKQFIGKFKLSDFKGESGIATSAEIKVPYGNYEIVAAYFSDENNKNPVYASCQSELDKIFKVDQPQVSVKISVCDVATGGSEGDTGDLSDVSVTVEEKGSSDNTEISPKVSILKSDAMPGAPDIDNNRSCKGFNRADYIGKNIILKTDPLVVSLKSGSFDCKIWGTISDIPAGYQAKLAFTEKPEIKMNANLKDSKSSIDVQYSIGTIASDVAESKDAFIFQSYTKNPQLNGPLSSKNQITLGAPNLIVEEAANELGSCPNQKHKALFLISAELNLNLSKDEGSTPNPQNDSISFVSLSGHPEFTVKLVKCSGK